MELGDMGSGCEEGDCGPASGYPEDCADECQWEEPMFGHSVCVTVVCVPLMLLGLLGNTLTILVVWLRPHMRSSTYLYLSSMAVSDLLILLLLPLDLYKLWRPRPWPLGDLACKLTMFLSECCTFSTILHITFLSLERYLAVCWPITAKTLVTRHRTKVLIGCLWLGAAVSAAPVLVIVGVEEVGGVEGWRGDDGWMWGDEGLDEVLLKGERRGGGGEMTLAEGTGGAKWTGERVRDWDEGGDMAWVSWGEKMEGRDGGGEMKGRGIQKQTGEEEMGVKTEERSGEEHEGGRRGHEEEKEERTEERRRGGRIEEDKSECRCTDYGVSSGLLSAMMILSNLYFLVPLSILGMVYSLIGRTLWLRPQSSVRDQTHRHTVKMLGVIVLVFVLCWLPFHVGRTLFSLSLGSSVMYYLSQYFNLVSSVLFYLSAAVNPLLYNLMSARYRRAVHGLVRSRRTRARPRCSSQPRQFTTHHSSTTVYTDEPKHYDHLPIMLLLLLRVPPEQHRPAEAWTLQDPFLWCLAPRHEQQIRQAL
ncbi:growth hormone secretagogue receptor type 1-like [Lampris incognitus]|uniref:growth hormone secretagogue receptor type 1-like n=1 Tax=Lampris incognitus TaxID=2546036 RepID=UPI0024B60C2B|nr:growth hormone secretagogue receptor type 1-like [Lampris incognitus]